MKLAIIFNPNNTLGKLTKLFTGEYAYHCGWVDEDNNVFYDMFWLRRKRPWPRYPDADVKLYDFPLVTTEYQERHLLTDDSQYGVMDYILFAIRPLFHLFGLSTRNASGVICSEMCNNDLINCGYLTYWDKEDAPPSPADLYKWAEERSQSERKPRWYT